MCYNILKNRFDIMNLLEKIIAFLQFKMSEPSLYGWFHLLSLIIMIGIIIFFTIKKFNVKKVLLIMSLIMIGFEIYKQLSFSYNDGVWYYQWYAFPFQFCSTPMYVALIAALTKNKKLEYALYSFLATYGLVGGIAVMLYPNTVYVSESLINIQTMIHHGFMVIMGMYLLISNIIKLNLKTILSALKVFIVLVMIALAIDICTYYLNIDNGLEMFFISPFHTSSLPVFSIIYEKVPYLLFLLIYILSFTFGSNIPLFIKKIVLTLKSK